MPGLASERAFGFHNLRLSEVFMMLPGRIGMQKEADTILRNARLDDHSLINRQYCYNQVRALLKGDIARRSHMKEIGKRLTMTLALCVMTVSAAAAQSPKEVSFPTADGGIVDADLYGKGTRGVVLAHGAIFNKESWAPLARRIADLGYFALAIDFRGYGKSKAGSDVYGLDQDVLAAVRWLHDKQEAESVSVIGGSMGGGAAARAATKAKRGEIDKLILLSPVPIEHPEQIKADSILFIASRNENLASEIRKQYMRAPDPRKLVFLDGSAHAQNIFATPQAERLTETILQYLTGRE